MSKAKKLLDEIIVDPHVTVVETPQGTRVLADDGYIIMKIEMYFRDIHDEAVNATVMAMNKKQFVKPEFKD